MSHEGRRFNSWLVGLRAFLFHSLKKSMFRLIGESKLFPQYCRCELENELLVCVSLRALGYLPADSRDTVMVQSSLDNDEWMCALKWRKVINPLLKKITKK